MYSKLLYFGAVALLLAVAGSARADLLLLDTFNSTQPSSYYSDFGFNQELTTRQSGLYAGTNWNTGGYSSWDPSCQQVNDTSFPGVLLRQTYDWTTERYAWVSMNQDFGRGSATTPTSVSATIRPITGDEGVANTATNWNTIQFIGASATPSNDIAPVADNYGVALLIRSNGEWQFFMNGSNVGSGSVASADTYDVALSENGSSVSAWIGATQIVANMALTGNALTRSSSYVCFGQESGPSWNRQLSTFDNVQVDGQVPEPSTLAMLIAGALGLVCYAWRKRK